MKVRSRFIALTLLLGILVGALALGGGSTGRAQSPNCDPSEQIACLELPDDPGGTTATAAPAPGPGSAIAAAINRANAAYVRALRTLDPTVLSGPLSGEAVARFENEIAVLRANDRYATPSLLSISAEDVRYFVQETRSPAFGVQVRTLEHWIYQERALGSGVLLVNVDEWVRNDYTLEQRADGWVVVRNLSAITDPPSAPRPAVSASVTTDRAEYEAGSSIGVTIVNDGATRISHGLTGYACGPVTLERLGEDGSWSTVPNPPTFAACTLIARLLNSGESESTSIAVPRGGVYRIVFRYSADGVNRPFVAYSAPLVVR